MKKIKSRNLRSRTKWGLRLGIFLVLLLVGIRFGTSVEAGMNDSTLVKNRIDNIYAVATINGEQRIFYLNMYTMNGRVSYCIDIGVDITTNIYNSTDNFALAYLADSKIDYIRLMSYFGYLYDGHDDYRYYMAAQELIWEYLDSNVEVEWTNVLDVNGERIDILKYKKELESLYTDYLTQPTFGSLKPIYVVGQEIVLVDSRKVLSSYMVETSKYSDAYIDGNNLVIKIGNIKGDEIIRVVKRKGYYDYNSTLYYYDGSQRLISNGNFRKFGFIIKFKIRGISLKAKVVDSLTGESIPLGQASLEGATYEVYDKDRKLLGTYETDENGNFKVDDLEIGTYYIKQVKASDGYLVSEEEISFELSYGNNEIKLEQEVMGNDIEIGKFYGDNGSYIPEVGIKFNIYDKAENIFGTIETNEEGMASIWLPHGDYRISQSNTTLGYDKVDDFWVRVNQAQDKVRYNLFNEFLMTKVRVITKDSVSGNLLKLKGISYKIRKEGEDNYLEYKGSSIFTTDDNGELLIPIVLSYGNYVLEQVNVPNGILLNEKGYEFSIDNKSSFYLIDDDLVMDVCIDNQFIMGKIEVLSNKEKFYSGDNGYGYEKISQIDEEICLIANDDIIVNGEMKYQKGEMVYNGVTDREGKLVIEGIYLGSYCLVNKSTSGEQCFELESINNTSNIISKEVEFTKKLDKGDIIIHNISNKGDDIKNTVFEVIDVDGKVIYSGITNEDGIIKVDDILVGDYCIKQKSISSKYEFGDKDICFSLDGEKKIEFVNEIVAKKVISIPNTLSEFIGFYEGTLILVLIGTGILVYKKIFASKLSR